jgi:hypothetical protein
MDEALDRAYRRTEYHVHLPVVSLCLHVDLPDPWADRQLRQAGVTGAWAIVSPCNPRSVALCAQENASRLEDFHRWLAESGRTWFASLARDPTGDWPDEPGALIAGLSSADAAALGRRLSQNAVVCGVPGSAPCLLWLD